MGKRHAFGLCLGMLGLLTVPHQNTRQGREAFAVTSAELRRLHGEVERLRNELLFTDFTRHFVRADDGCDLHDARKETK